MLEVTRTNGKKALLNIKMIVWIQEGQGITYISMRGETYSFEVKETYEQIKKGIEND